MMILHAPHRTDGPRRRWWAIAGSTACAAAWALAATLVMPVDRAVAAAPDGSAVATATDRAASPPVPDARSASDADPRCAPLHVGPAREVAAERRAEAEPMLSTVLERPDGSWLCIQRRGAAQFGADGRLLSSLPDGDWLVVAGTDGDGQRRVEMEGRAGAADTYWLVDGEEHPYGDEAQAWLVGALQQLDRHRTILPVRSLREFRPLPDTIHNLEQLREELQTRREEAGVGSPMVVIDGVVIDRDPASMIDPERIETIQVIPGEEGAERYGPRARYGIVVITTNPR